MVLFTAILVLGTLVLIFILFSKWRYQYWSRKGVPQLEPKLIFGDFKPILTGVRSQQEYFVDLYKTCKAKGLSQLGIYSFLKPEWMIVDLKIIKNIFIRDFQYFSDHGLYQHDNEPITKNLFSLGGEKWKTLRAKLTPTFTTGKMKMMFETLYEKAIILKKVIGQCADIDQEIQVKEILARFGTDVIGSVAFGIECNSMEDPDNQLREIGKLALAPNLFKVFVEEMIPYDVLGKLGYLTFPKKVGKYFSEVITETIKYRENNNVERKDFMHLMLQLKNQNKNLTDTEILSQSFVFYLGGFETSSSTATFALLELAHKQEIQDKLRQEIHDVLEKHDDKISYDALMEMVYMEKVIHETLRKYPPISILTRVCTKRYTSPESGLIIEKGTRVYIPAWGIQKDPEYYQNPEEFNPENFSQENKSKRPDFSWMPFGEGPRICIGLRFGMMQTKVALTTMLKDFRISPHIKTEWPLVIEESALLLTVKGDVWLKLERL